MNKIKILFVLLGLCLSLNVVAQEKITFMGVHLKGDIFSFADSLVAKNPQLQIIKSDSTGVCLMGDFYQFKNKEITVTAAKNDLQVNSVYMNLEAFEVVNYLSDLSKDIAYKYGVLSKEEDDGTFINIIWEIGDEEICISSLKRAKFVTLYYCSIQNVKAAKEREYQQTKERIKDL